MVDLASGCPRENPAVSVRVVLVEPEIPPNTGNVARTCSTTGTGLHLVGPLGFRLDDRHLRRAGLDYWPDLLEFGVYRDWDEFMQFRPGWPLVLATSRGETWHTGPCPSLDGGPVGLIFGSESAGLPTEIMESGWPRIRIPMTGGSRSLNLASSVAVVLYEVLRRRGFPGLV